MLHLADRHQPLTDQPWDPALARQAIDHIVADLVRHRRADGHWPPHPQDQEGDGPTGGFKSLYLGSAGLQWALWTLQRQAGITLPWDPAEAIGAVHQAYRAHPDTGEVVPSYFLGETGILMAQWRMRPSAEVAERLHAVVEANIDNPTNEALWAAPGTMLAAWHLWQATHDERWRTLYLRNVNRLWDTWLWDEAAGCHLWTQQLYGRTVQYLGAGHGLAGNVFALLIGASLLDDERREALCQRSLAALQRFARVRDGAANWPPASTPSTRPGAPEVLMQWCHGAPGIVTSLAGCPLGQSSEMDTLLRAAGQAIWAAGPLAKGQGLCHGTAGNGYALLALHQRTGEALWLDRARAFAMHAIVQCDAARHRHGHGRHTLWTGDAGVAIYLWHCLQGEGGLPLLDLV